MTTKFGTDLTTGSIPRHIVTFSLPMLLGSLVQTASSFVNAIWVGRFLGTSALAAVTVSFPFIFILFGIGMGMTLATNILVSQNYGARRFEELRRVVDSTTVLVIGLGLVLTVLGEVLAPSILRAMDTPAEVFPAATSYLRIFLLSMPFSFAMLALRSLYQGVGDSKTPLYFQFAGVALITVLDPVLIFGWLGLPRLGLDGTAWATLISQALVFLAAMVYVHKAKAPIAPGWPVLRGLRPMLQKTVRIGAPASVQQSLVSIGMLLVTGVVNGFGEVATAAYGAASRIDQIAFLPAINFGMAISTLAGQNIGAGHESRVRQIFKTGCLFSGAITIVISAVAVLFPEALLRIFVTDPVVIELGTSYLHIVGACYVVFGLMFVSNGIINGAGDTIVTTVMSLVSLWMVRVPVAYLLSRQMHSVKGIWYAIALSFFVSLTASMAYYFSGRWKRALNKKKGEPEVAPAEPQISPADPLAAPVEPEVAKVSPPRAEKD
ncbi:MATE family efflux transporter [Archangium primigenium]|uniref:MATE family efflux transporter n=1 Tax=[Archangium] primigenium TaxID=2792470 RepID=UPI00195E02D4|nr:MATE family efflux transporter [Archangium primigenium]MBM7119106.1 MATE family efflux transporter [Archangium primigenium]